jgi:transcriptional regulator with XRE-family HTH domain
MNTNTNHSDIKQNLQDLFKPRDEKEEIKHDSLMLMAAFLSEIELAQEQQNISRAELANKIETSASYLTQVFRSKKPLNFFTLAKIKRALNLRFEIKAFPKNTIADVSLQKPIFKPIQISEFAERFLSFQNSDEVPVTGSKFFFSSDYFETKPTKGEEVS